MYFLIINLKGWPVEQRFPKAECNALKIHEYLMELQQQYLIDINESSLNELSRESILQQI